MKRPKHTLLVEITKRSLAAVTVDAPSPADAEAVLQVLLEDDAELQEKLSSPTLQGPLWPLVGVDFRVVSDHETRDFFAEQGRRHFTKCRRHVDIGPLQGEGGGDEA